MTETTPTTTSTSTPTTSLTFPAGFSWGAATAAFQIEGATHEDGRTDSVWDTFARTPGKVLGGDTGDPACDHYHRMPQDVALLAELNLDTYRFSTSWARVRPDGGPPNQKGLDFYSRLVDELLAKGIRPWLTLYHWDLPQALEDQGGWTSRDTAYRFADYAQTVHDALGDRVPTWTTLNEPYCAALLGYAGGQHAPGRTEPRAAVAAVHHLLLAHGLGVQVLRDAGVGGETGSVGITLNLLPVSPADHASAADVDVARRVDGLQNRIWLDPVLRGRYPDDVLEDLAPYGVREVVQDGDLETIGAPIDVLGVNYYFTFTMRAAEQPRLPSEWVGAETATDTPEGLPVTAMGWEVEPSGLRDMLLRLQDEYPGTPLVVTENGAAFDDEVAPDGAVHDEDRRSYLEGHLRAAHEAIEAGVDLRGYLAWSLLDNFEWAFGYSRRFGIVRVDYETQERTVKDSARWYAEVARRNGF
ncbi:MAG TPA: GH1 family beta-glucosidase [Actinomycetes bacterium]|nr:GH1 family beta-glucosidase [Actinomycetes bacterium]